MNKAVSLAATILVACSYLIGRVVRRYNDDPRRKLVVIKFCGLIGFSLAALHAIASLCLLTPAYFAKYFSDDGCLNVEGELGLVVGLVALWALSLPAITTLPMMPKGARKRTMEAQSADGVLVPESCRRTHGGVGGARMAVPAGMALRTDNSQPRKTLHSFRSEKAGNAWRSFPPILWRFRRSPWFRSVCRDVR